MTKKHLLPFALLLALFLPTCLAFNPSWFLVSGIPTLSPTDILKTFWDVLNNENHLSWGRPHEAMTADAVKNIYAPWFGIPKEKATGSMLSALEEMKTGTKVVDEHGDKEAEAPECHCDDENLQQCNQRLIDIRKEIPSLLQLGSVGQARNKLGRALHTLQDFYSHTNWVELGESDINSKLGRSWPFTYTQASATDPTCVYCSYDPVTARDAVLAAANQCRTVSNDDVFTDWAKEKIGACFLKESLIGKDLPAKCDNNLRAPLVLPNGNLLTSGYFGTKKALHTRASIPQKCSHGGLYDRDADGKEGISKDTQSVFMTPHWNLHPKAAALADKATNQYIEDVANEICPSTPFKDCALLRLLYGIGPVLSFVIDTTTSMTSIIAGVRNDAIQIVNNVRGTADEPSLYVLSEINDPTVPKARLFTNTDKFIEAILALNVYDNGNPDCPELGMAGIAQAVGNTPDGGDIFVWTDAATKDKADASTLAKAANS